MTERIQALGETAQKLIAKVPAGRAGEPDEFGAACAFLCGTQAAFITGQNLLLDGGLVPVTV
jgi:3-oxoacyl-[acyl-carrier protein] reductase